MLFFLSQLGWLPPLCFRSRVKHGAGYLSATRREPAGAGDMLPLGGLEIGSGEGAQERQDRRPILQLLGPPRALASPVLRE